VQRRTEVALYLGKARRLSCSEPACVLEPAYEWPLVLTEMLRSLLAAYLRRRSAAHASMRHSWVRAGTYLTASTSAATLSGKAMDAGRLSSGSWSTTSLMLATSRSVVLSTFAVSSAQSHA